MAIDPEIFEKVQATLCDALSVDEDEVTEEATLVGDLGAESIDFLDIVFHLEKAFNIKVTFFACIVKPAIFFLMCL